MPYKSQKQAAYLHIHEPELAAKWDREYYGKKKRKKVSKSVEEEPFLEMPNQFSEPETKPETYTGIRVRDTKTGRFVAGSPSLIAKRVTISKLSGYDYNDPQRGHVIATRVGYTESKDPYPQALRAAERAGKKAGKIRVFKPKTWNKDYRTTASSQAKKTKLKSLQSDKGTYRQPVWEHKSKGGKTYKAGYGPGKPYKGKYKEFTYKNKTWGTKDSVIKSSPDQADVHILGNGTKLKKVKPRQFPAHIRRTK